MTLDEKLQIIYDTMPANTQAGYEDTMLELYKLNDRNPEFIDSWVKEIQSDDSQKALTLFNI